MRYLNCFNQFIGEYEKTYPLPLLEKSIQHMEAVKILIEEKLKNAAMGEPNPELVQQTDELIERLKGFFDDDGIVELTGLITFQNLSSKFNSALDVPS